MSHSEKERGTREDQESVSGPKGMSRRSLLKGSVKAMPVVLTLHSGAALARSSNLISGHITPQEDLKGRTYCLDTTSVYSTDSPDIYDLGESPSARVHMINEREYYKDKDGSYPVSESVVCEGGTFYFEKDGEMHAVTKPRGMLVSAAALTSFAGAVKYTDL